MQKKKKNKKKYSEIYERFSKGMESKAIFTRITMNETFIFFKSSGYSTLLFQYDYYWPKHF